MDGNVLTTIAQWIATASVTGGLVYTWRRNLNHQSQIDTQLKTELTLQIKAIKDKLDDPNEGLGAIKREINGIKEHCAAVTSGCSERFKHVEEDIHKLEGFG